MFLQLEYSDVIKNFLGNEDYLKGFVSLLEIPIEQRWLKGELFDDNEFVNWSQRSPTIEGFVIKNERTECYVVSPSKNYMSFWGHRNFFVWRLAQRHAWKNDNVVRYVVNFIYPSQNNKIENKPKKVETFDKVKDFYIVNFYMDSINTDLSEWLNALYKDI